MNELITIQANVPICLRCGAAMRFNPITLEYKCFDCKERYKVIDNGNNDREFICERRVLCQTQEQ